MVSSFTAAESSSPSLQARALALLGAYISPECAKTVLDSALQRARVSAAALEEGGVSAAVLEGIERGLVLFLEDQAATQELLERLKSLAVSAPAESLPDSVEVPVRDEDDIVTARTTARTYAGRVGFTSTDQTKIATAVSELARNIQKYVGKGTVTITILSTPRPGISIVAEDQGNGIANLDDILAAKYVSKTGLGLGLRGCRTLMDEFDVDTGPGKGTKVTLRKFK